MAGGEGGVVAQVPAIPAGHAPNGGAVGASRQPPPSRSGLAVSPMPMSHPRTPRYAPHDASVVGGASHPYLTCMCALRSVPRALQPKPRSHLGPNGHGLASSGERHACDVAQWCGGCRVVALTFDASTKLPAQVCAAQPRVTSGQSPQHVTLITRATTCHDSQKLEPGVGLEPELGLGPHLLAPVHSR